MSNTFVPLITAPVSTGQPATFQLKVLPQAEAKSIFEPLAAAPAREQPNPCGQPKVTLRRQGETVCGIHVECGCGQVIELACVY